MALTQVNSAGIKDDSIKNADIKSDAAIAGSKLVAATTSVPGSMSAADKTKLDAIDASADVTDATTVNAAGAVMNSDVDAKGDLLVGTADNTVAALTSSGTNDHVLTVDTSTTTGLKWAAASGGATINNATENEIVTVASTTSQLDAEAKFTYDGNTAVLQTTSDGDAISVVRNSADANPVNISLTKSRNATYGSNTLVNNSDQIGEIVWKADDGTDYASEAGAIRVDIDGAPGSNNMPGRMEFFTGAASSGTAAKRLTLQSSGNVYIEDGDLTVNSGHGIDFSLTADGPMVSHASELFDDYEEGTWNVTFNGNVSGQSGADKGQYIKIGRIVHITGQVHLENSANTDNVEINNLPFTSGASRGEGSGSQYPLAGSYELNHQSDCIGVRWYIAESTQTAKLIDMRDNIGYSQVPAVPNKYVFLTSTYFADS